MEKRQIGKSSLFTAPLVFGGNVFGWTIDEPTSFELMDAFTAGGFNCIDTADSYSRWVAGNKGGESETIIGNWMTRRRNRASVLICTKVGSDMGQGRRDISKAYILKAAEDSLKRLQTDYIDLYQTHWDDGTTPVEETLEAYQLLIKAGKVRWIGASNLSAERLASSLEAASRDGLPRYECLQPQYNLYDREGFEKELQPLCSRQNLGVITYFSLASGFLTGKYRADDDLLQSKRGEFMKKYYTPRGFRIVDALVAVAKRHHSTPAAISLAWLIARPGVTAPIASATSTAQLEALFQATAINLSATDVAELDHASAWPKPETNA